MRFIPAWAGNSQPAPGRGQRKSVHPRMGGEQASIPHRPDNITGSSPHGRGTVLVTVCLEGGERFIPAWAGNRSHAEGMLHQQPVHPRMGGEQGTEEWLAMRAGGSSPHGRGTGWRARLFCRSNRFIPAWAGNSCVSTRPVLTSSVHPRMGGEQNSVTEGLRAVIGSSPHGRGTVTLHFLRRNLSRFIPAWAGNSLLTD